MQTARSSNYYNSTLTHILPHIGYKRPRKPIDAADRDVLACQLAACESLPRAVCDLYDAAPSRDLWKAMLTEWLRQAHTRCKGMLNHYYLKCTLGRLFAVRDIGHGTISWWPTDCAAYVHWYDVLYPHRRSRARFNETEKFQILCAIYRKLNATINNSIFTTAVAQTCWTMKENKGTLIVA